MSDYEMTSGLSDDILTPLEVAVYLKIHRTTVWRWIRDRKLPSFRIGSQVRIHRRDLEAFMLAGTSEGGDETQIKETNETAILP